MISRTQNLLPRVCFLLIRASIVVIALTGVVWAAWAFPIFSRQSSIDGVATKIIAGARYDAEALSRLDPILEDIENAGYCQAIATRDAAVIRLHKAELTISSGDQDNLDSSLEALLTSLLRSLACSPADSFSWLALFWLKNVQAGYVPANQRFLRMSYQLGPNEGWIALKRSHIAFSIFEGLDPDLKERAKAELVGLLQTGLVEAAADIFVGPAWSKRDEITPLLVKVPQRTRELFSEYLHYRGYDIVVPGVHQPSSP